MKFLVIMLLILFFSCKGEKKESHSSKAQSNTIVASASTDSSMLVKPAAGDSGIVFEDEYETYYVVVADTGLSYFELRDKMNSLSGSLNQQIDTMDRDYNSSKDLIALPENSEDEIYAGDYFPRRSPTTDLSLEYLNFYNEKSTEKTIALVTGMYSEKNAADSALNILTKISPKAFVIKSEIYMGCMH